MNDDNLTDRLLQPPYRPGFLPTVTTPPPAEEPTITHPADHLARHLEATDPDTRDRWTPPGPRLSATRAALLARLFPTITEPTED